MAILLNGKSEFGLGEKNGRGGAEPDRNALGKNQKLGPALLEPQEK